MIKHQSVPPCDPLCDPHLIALESFTLRDYQHAAIRHVLAALKRGQGEVYITLPTGTGKAVILAALAARLASNGRILVVVHTQELVNQLAEKMRLCFPAADVGIVMNVQDDCRRPVIVACIATLRSEKRLRRILDASPVPFSALLIDECHHATRDNSYGRLADTMIDHSPHVAIIGCSATPYRADKQHTLIPRCVFARDLADMIDLGWLAPLSWRRVAIPLDLRGVKSTSRDGDRDYASESLALALNQSDTNERIAHDTAPLLAGRRVLIFGADVSHAHALADAYNAIGITAAPVWGEMDTNDRRRTLAAWRSDAIQAVSNCALLTEGFDYPAIDAIVIARPTQSLGRYMQMIGRGTRIAPGKRGCLIIDVVGNADVTDPRQVILPAIMPLASDDAPSTVEGEIGEDESDDAAPRSAPDRIVHLIDPRRDPRYRWLYHKASGAYLCQLNEHNLLIMTRDPFGSGLYRLAMFTRQHEASDGRTIPPRLDWLYPDILPLAEIRQIAQIWIGEHGRLWLTGRDLYWLSLSPTPSQLSLLEKIAPPMHAAAVALHWDRGRVAEAITLALFGRNVAPRLAAFWRMEAAA